jgi:prevent-host-death family protein
MVTETNAVHFRKNLGEMLNQVQYRHDSILINKDGKPVAALVDVGLFARIRKMESRLEALCKRIESGYSEIPESSGMDEIDQVVASERHSSRIPKKKN